MPDEPVTMQCMEVWGGNQAVDTSVTLPGLDAWVYSRPYQDDDDGGGDVYYVSSCATGRITRLLVADVSGHGKAVAQMAVALRGLMRQYVNHIEQAGFVKSMNRQFVALSEAGIFATSVVTSFFAPTGELSICNAGHPPPLVYRTTTKTWSYLHPKELIDDVTEDSVTGASNIPLGIVDMTDYEQFGAVLGLGDMVLCYTDSLVEARNPAGEMLMQVGLLRLVREVDAEPAATLVPRLVEKILVYTGSHICDDDLTALLFRANGTAPSQPLGLKLLAPFRILAGSCKAIFTGERLPFPEFTVASLGGAWISALNRVRRRGMR